MLDAAEEIACEIGIGAITLSGVQQRAGQANKSAAAYHFGNLDGLLTALITRRVHPIDARRRALLDDLDAAGAPDSPDALLAVLTHALVAPLVEESGPDSRWGRFTAQASLDPRLGALVLNNPEASGLRETTDRIRELLAPRLGPVDAELRIAAAILTTVTTLAMREGYPNLPAPSVPELVGIALAVLAAPGGGTSPAAPSDPPRPTSPSTPQE